jgi:hypothetical protein
MTRIREWQSALAELIGARMSMPFAWGEHDCCLFAADCVKAITGHDPAADARGSYSDERGAVRVLSKMGGLEQIAATRCGDEVPPAMARIGDVVLGMVDRECLGVCTGETWHVPSAGGLVARSMSEALKAWRV